MEETKPISISRLIAIPALITLGVTILRLVGELQHWSPLFFSTQAGGRLALVGISWLPIIFGPYFAMKLANAGDGPTSMGKAIGFAALSLVVLAAGGTLFGLTISHPSFLTLLAAVVMLGAAFVPGIGWRAFGKTLVAYAFAARIPVLIVMYFAMRGNGGAGWGTHYDAVAPALAHLSLTRKFIYLGVLPQMTIWIGWTAFVGSLTGSIFAAIAGRGKHMAPASS